MPEMSPLGRVATRAPQYPEYREGAELAIEAAREALANAVPAEGEAEAWGRRMWLLGFSALTHRAHGDVPALLSVSQEMAEALAEGAALFGIPRADYEAARRCAAPPVVVAASQDVIPN